MLQHYENIVGVQIRRTDHKASIEHSLTEKIEMEMDKILEKKPDTVFGGGNR